MDVLWPYSRLEAEVFRNKSGFVCRVYGVKKCVEWKNLVEVGRTWEEREFYEDFHIPNFSGGSKTAKRINRTLAERGEYKRLTGSAIRLISG